MAAISEHLAAAGAGATVLHQTLTVHTEQPLQLIDVTQLIEDAVREAGLDSGVANVQTRHTTTGILVNEYEPLLLADLRALFERLAPMRFDYAHDDFLRRTVNLTADERANGHAHCRAALLRSSETLGVRGGRLDLGRWQRVIFAEFDGGQRRQLGLTMLGSVARSDRIRSA
jgi:secondary thiamine-phosphate synthase enzyme